MEVASVNVPAVVAETSIRKKMSSPIAGFGWAYVEPSELWPVAPAPVMMIDCAPVAVVVDATISAMLPS